MPKIANTNESPVWVTSRLHGHCVDTSAPRAGADVIGGKADVEIEGLLSARERTFSPPDEIEDEIGTSPPDALIET